MQPNVKIATCCYCSARTMLKPTARDGHELACGSCGAPLHEMKWLKAPAATPVRASAPKEFVRKTSKRKQAKPSKPKWPSPTKQRKRRKPAKKLKSFFSDIAEEVWDFAEDIFD